MNIERGIFEEEDEEAEAASIARAEADIAAGRLVPHSEVKKWLDKWGTADETPMPSEWLR